MVVAVTAADFEMAFGKKGINPCRFLKTFCGVGDWLLLFSWSTKRIGPEMCVDPDLVSSDWNS